MARLALSLAAFLVATAPLALAEPVQKERLQDNLEKWKQLPPERKAALRRNEFFRRKRVIREINDAIAKSGLQLTEEERQLFTYRYAQERRKIEEELRAEMERKRRAATEHLLSNLVKEFEAEKATP